MRGHDFAHFFHNRLGKGLEMEKLLNVVVRALSRVFLNFAYACADKPFKVGLIRNVNAIEVHFYGKNGEQWLFECYYPLLWEDQLVMESDLGHTLQEVLEKHFKDRVVAFPQNLHHVSIVSTGIKIGTCCQYGEDNYTGDFMANVLIAWQKELQKPI